MEILASLPIRNALALLDSEYQTLNFFENGLRFVVHAQDLHKMDAMGLGFLPIDAIAVPDLTPLSTQDRTSLYEKTDISKRLTRYFPGHFVAALYELQSIFNKFNMKGYVVGGIVRDLLLHEERRLELNDVDITVEGDALACTDSILETSRNFFLDDRFPAFGTAIIHYKSSIYIDVASTRKENYPSCGALPVVFERGVPLADDVVRRDFTVNALALSIHDLGKVIDYTGGIQDIADQQIRVLHPVSFFEDPSRILRALKFCTRLDFQLSVGTRRLLEKFLHYGASVYKGGGERIKEELYDLLSGEETPTKEAWLEYFQEIRGIRLLHMNLPEEFTAHPDPTDFWKTVSESLRRIEAILAEEGEVNAAAADLRWEVYLSLLLRHLNEEWTAQVSLRLGLTKNERESVEMFQKLTARKTMEGLEECASAVDIYKLFQPIPLAASCATMLMVAQEAPRQFDILLEALATYKTKLESVKVIMDGNDLMELGIPKGVQIGTTLKTLLYAKLAGGLKDRMDEVHYVQKLMEAETVSDIIPELPESVSETPPQ